MENKLRKEHLNRQEKVRKLDNYREVFLKESRNKSSTQHIEHFRKSLAYKESLIDRYFACAYRIGSHYVLLDWDFEEFIAGNKLEVANQQALQHFDLLEQKAVEDFGAIVQSIRAAEVIWDYDNQGNWRPSMEIKPLLKCDEVFPRTEHDELYIKRLVGNQRHAP